MAIPIIKMITIGIMPSALKVMYYKMRGAKIGSGVKIGLLSIINSKEITIGENSKIGPFSFINVRKLIIGKRVKINMMVAIDTNEVYIDNDSTIMEQVVIGGMLTSRSIIRIGKRVKIFPYSFLNPTEQIVIEDDVGIGGANYIFTHGSWQSILDGFPIGFGPVTIKKGAWFPWRVFVMPNVTVGEYATIGAGSVITKDIPAKSLAAGVPAKVLKQGEEYIKQYSEDEKVNLVKDIIIEFYEYIKFKYEDNSYKLANNGDSIIISIWANKNIKFIRKYDNSIDDLMIVYNRLSDDEILFLNNNNIKWFDIEGKRTFYKDDVIWNEVRDYFSRYGIRFEVES